ncbi:unnamed protein product [Haemonchus placei]|uniref:Uncharacterized protein n=1 Tax=Haemonchus placei TaxID=6290 RepID=A0A0N4WGS6_HAEPC|nr:unnamed protein product [Haemonchus placei]
MSNYDQNNLFNSLHRYALVRFQYFHNPMYMMVCRGNGSHFRKAYHCRFNREFHGIY